MRIEFCNQRVHYYILPTIRLWWEKGGEISINLIWFNRSFDIIIREEQCTL